MSPDAPTPQLSPDEQRKARRALIILYTAMLILGSLPLLALWWANRGK